MSGIGFTGAAREWIGAFVLLFVIGGFLLFWQLRPKEEGCTALVMVDNQTVYTFSLGDVGETEVYPLDTQPKTWVEVSPQGIRFVDSQCPDKICLQYGILNEAGQIAVCLPAKAMIQVIGSQGPDAVVG